MNWIFADIQNNHNKHVYTQNTISKYIVIQLIKYNHQIHNYTDNQSHAVINIMHRMKSQIHIQAMYMYIIQILTHIIRNMHIDINNKYTNMHRCATDDIRAQTTRLCAHSRLTSTRLTSDSPHSIKPIQFISEQRQFGTPRKLSHSENTNKQGSNFTFVTNNQPQHSHYTQYT